MLLNLLPAMFWNDMKFSGVSLIVFAWNVGNDLLNVLGSFVDYSGILGCW